MLTHTHTHTHTNQFVMRSDKLNDYVQVVASGYLKNVILGLHVYICGYDTVYILMMHFCMVTY